MIFFLPPDSANIDDRVLDVGSFLQCEQTNDTVGCTTIGVCGKTAETAALQDLLKHSLKGLAAWAHHARSETAYDNPEMDTFIANAMFSTLTNVNFDESRFPEFIHECQM